VLSIKAWWTIKSYFLLLKQLIQARSSTLLEFNTLHQSLKQIQKFKKQEAKHFEYPSSFFLPLISAPQYWGDKTEAKLTFRKKNRVNTMGHTGD